MGVTMGHVPDDDGRPNPLVLHYKLDDDRVVFVRYARAHHAAHPAPRHQPVQPARDSRGGAGGERLEASTRRCLPPTRRLRHAVGVRWHWVPTHRHDVRHYGVCGAWISLPRQPRRVDDGHAALIRHHGDRQWVRQRAPLQDVQGCGLEDQHAQGGFHLPGGGLCGVLHPQLFYLGAKVLGRGAVRDVLCAHLPVVWHLSAAGVHGGLLRIQKRGA
mmetsp:Transcript_43026/g.69186  ORF Transcript_43026/g.69186 Transcript_43026/m.69186 type:complete len:216 (-) Transcript_43026:1227-1874(-)